MNTEEQEHPSIPRGLTVQRFLHLFQARQKIQDCTDEGQAYPKAKKEIPFVSSSRRSQDFHVLFCRFCQTDSPDPEWSYPALRP